MARKKKSQMSRYRRQMQFYKMIYLVWKKRHIHLVLIRVEIDVYGCTMYKIMSNALNYGKYLAYIKGQLYNNIKAYRQNLVSMIYKKYLKPENWHCICFSDEVHFSYGFDRQLQIIQYLSICYCHYCIQHQFYFLNNKKIGNTNIVRLW